MKDVKISIVTGNEKVNGEKRLAKPLPVNPISPFPENLALDDTSRVHLSTLINNWLNDLNLPIKPWSNILYDISIDLFEKSLKYDNDTVDKQIHLQTLSTNTPTDSKFLMNVYHGTSVHDDGYYVSFPIGGTIRIYGINDETITEKFFDLVKSLVYLINSLYLELYVMRDSNVKLVVPEPTKTNFLKQYTLLNLTQPKPLDSSNHEKGSTGIFGWLKKIRPHVSSTKPTIEKYKEDKKKKRNSSNTVDGVFINSNNKNSDTSAQTELQTQQGDPLRFLNLKKSIDNALISSSPNCYFHYPALLNRLQEEESMILSQKQSISKSEKENNIVKTPTHERRPSLIHKRKSSLIASFTKQHTPAVVNEIKNIQLPQSVTAYSSIRVPDILADSKKGLEHLLLDTTSLASFNAHQSLTVNFTCYPIGCPDRPCLGPLMSKIDYFRFQAPRNTNTIYPQIDQSIGDTIRHWYNQIQSPCQLHIDEQTQFIPGLLVETPIPITNSTKDLSKSLNGNSNHSSRPTSVSSEHAIHSKNSESSILTLTTPFFSKPASANNRHCSKFHGCNQPLLDHVFSFTHGNGRINVYANAEEGCNIESKDLLTTWISCNTCDATTSPILISKKAASYSFAKYLELLFYSQKIYTPEPFCEHTRHADKKAILIRCFLYNGIVFKFMHEEIKSYELRLPRLQIIHNSIISNEKISFLEPRMSIYTLKDWKYQSAERDVNLFFQTVKVHLDLLNHYTIAESKRKSRSTEQNLSAIKQLQSESKVLETEIKTLNKRLDTDHVTMLNALINTNINELNDFRRFFALQSDAILEYLTKWQNEHCKEVLDTCTWDKPGYIESKSIHCFPGSSILVYENEPTSIIAYTLSSNDYIQELLIDENLENNEKDSTSNKTVSVPSLTSTDDTNDSTKTIEIPANTNTNHLNKPLPPLTPLSPPNIIDGYYSSIERKYISPSTGATSETASFRTMITEVVKSSVPEVSRNKSKRLDDFTERISSWTKKQEAKLENNEGDLKRKFNERVLKPLNSVKQPGETKEVRVSSFYESIETKSKKSVSPHIKHKFVHEGIEFTCIVYYAKEFEILRRHCDINQLMIESLSRCQAWTASGGKSKSHFYKTQDDRFVIKEMVNAWNIAEKDAFLKFAPKYFEHLKKSSNEPSILAKVFGFFTIRMKNATDKKSILNLDVMVMEHLFYSQKIVKRFDFKGIQDRHVEEYRKQQKDATLWDGDWLDEYRTKLPVHEHSKAITELAILNDTEFLSKCNIMDYSLLVGIDENKHEISIGIVDFIGAYTWYKKIESRSKSTLLQRKEVTIVPPDQYRLRFCREVCDYFIPVPGKFDIVEPSKTLPSLLI